MKPTIYLLTCVLSLVLAVGISVANTEPDVPFSGRAMVAVAILYFVALACVIAWAVARTAKPKDEE